MAKRPLIIGSNALQGDEDDEQIHALDVRVSRLEVGWNAMSERLDDFIIEMRKKIDGLNAKVDEVERLVNTMAPDYSNAKQWREWGIRVVGGVAVAVATWVVTSNLSGCSLQLPPPLETPTPPITETAAPSETPTLAPTLTHTLSPTPTETPEATPEDKATPTPVWVPSPTPPHEPTPDVEPTPTQIAPPVDIPDDRPNLLRNQGFEEPYRLVIFPEVNVAYAWEPFYCDEPYTEQRCAAPRQGTGNPPGLVMGRPEFKIAAAPGRAVAGIAQQWFCFYRTCDAGVFQTVDVTPGAWCEAGAQVQSWSANGTGLLSDLETTDQRDNSTWYIRVDRLGLDNAFGSWVLVSRGFGYDDDIYDQFTEISYVFQAVGPRVTVYFENIRLWPIANNDNYIDRAYLRCTE